jgi:hypothetical protein
MENQLAHHGWLGKTLAATRQDGGGEEIWPQPLRPRATAQSENSGVTLGTGLNGYGKTILFCSAQSTARKQMGQTPLCTLERQYDLRKIQFPHVFHPMKADISSLAAKVRVMCCTKGVTQPQILRGARLAECTHETAVKCASATVAKAALLVFRSPKKRWSDRTRSCQRVSEDRFRNSHEGIGQRNHLETDLGCGRAVK